jgi:hypothetical protein
MNKVLPSLRSGSGKPFAWVLLTPFDSAAEDKLSYAMLQM